MSFRVRSLAAFLAFITVSGTSYANTLKIYNRKDQKVKFIGIYGDNVCREEKTAEAPPSATSAVTFYLKTDCGDLTRIRAKRHSDNSNLKRIDRPSGGFRSAYWFRHVSGNHLFQMDDPEVLLQNPR